MMKIMEKNKLIKYKGAGLNNIYLASGYVIKKTRYGNAIAIDDMEGLHQAIGRNLVENRAELTGAEFRFLRKEMNLSQKELGRFIGVGEQSIAQWEKTSKVQPYGDRFVRALYKEGIDGKANIRELVQHLNKIDKQKRGKIIFQETDSGWVPESDAA